MRAAEEQMGSANVAGPGGNWQYTCDVGISRKCPRFPEVSPMPKKQYWLFKSEPETFSIQDLQKLPNQTSPWDGVRNYQARNFLRDQVKVDDGVLFYHSSTELVGIAGEAVVVRSGYPDETQFQPKSKYFDPKSTQEKPIWYVVDVRFVRATKAIITRRELEKVEALRKMVVLKRGIRLSIQSVTKEEWKAIMALPVWR